MTASPTHTAAEARSPRQSAFQLPAAVLADLRELTPSEPSIDMAKLLERCLGNQSFAQMLLDEFQSSVSQQMVAFASFVVNGNGSAIQDLAHALKGTAGTLAAEALRRSAANLEAAARADDWTLIPEHVVQVHREAQRCLAEISRHRLVATASESSSFPRN